MSRASTPTSRRARGPYGIPHRLQNFTVHAQVGSGATACTFVGSEPGPGGVARLKCLKIPSPQLLRQRSPEEIRAIFMNEAAALQRLPAANIAPLERIVQLGDDEGVILLVYAFIDGMNLRELIEKTRAERLLLPWKSVVGIARDMAIALEEAHRDRRGEASRHNHPPIVHRDIAPSNSMADIHGNVFLVDYGFARSMDASLLHASRLYVGRIAYAAPEYGRGGTYGPQLDLFSMGCVLFEALTSVPPFPHNETADEHIARVWAKDRPHIEDIRPEFQEADGPDPELVRFVSIVNCLLEPAPANRFETAGALLSALSSLRVGVDPRPLGRLVQRFQSPWQHRVTEGRIDRREIMERVRQSREPKHAPTGPTPPEEIVVELAAARELDQFTDPPPPMEGSALELGLDFGATHPDPPVIPVTNPSASDVPFPSTNPSNPALELDETSGVRVATAPRSTPVPAAPEQAHRPAHPQHPFTTAQLHLPAYEPSSRSDATSHERRLRGAAIALVLLFVVSIFMLGTLSTLWVPLFTGQLGWTIVDGFWTPLLTRVGTVGVGLSLLGGGGLALHLKLRRRPRANRAPNDSERHG